ncbi:MAG: Asp23/Gls24 family envelope stress response protein [Acidimicrobiia bacterium]
MTPELGRTTIAPAVFERLAARAATEVAGVHGEVRTGLARFLPWVAGSPAEASAEMDDESVILDLTFNVAYPEPVRQVAEQVRRHVADRVGSLTGHPVRQVNITVPELILPVRPRHQAKVTS